MPDKQWYMEWHVGDWLKDPAVTLLKAGTRGVWMDAICVMHESDQCGLIEGTVVDLARLCRCTSNEMRAALDDLKLRNAADISERVTDGNVRVTLINRRMRRKWTDRKSNRDRQKRFKDRKRNGGNNSEVTDEITPLYTNTTTTTPDPPNPPPGGDGGPEFWDLFPEGIRTPEVRAAWSDWIQHRRERKPKVTPMSAQKSISDLKEIGPERAVAAIHHSIAKGWQGIFEAKPNGTVNGANGHANPTRDDRRIEELRKLREERESRERERKHA